MVADAGRTARPPKWNTRIELANAMFDYLEIWHNRKRRHSQLGMLSPIEFERNRIITVA
ncbi:IS3 family transposase [Aeromicrobium sp.]|uniref:IS3 family transposase n=1 Tax=Aeromicrobium sp. TaxID=1871063 RepID=UPI0030BCC686